MKFDLEDRTTKFGIDTINSLKNLEENTINKIIISQVVRSSTSIGANYAEANECNSKRDFIHKINLAKKEAKETIHWLKIIKATTITNMENLEKLKAEAQELVLIFSKIISTTKKK